MPSVNYPFVLIHLGFLPVSLWPYTRSLAASVIMCAKGLVKDMFKDKHTLPKRVFISWSGVTSQTIADALKEAIECVFTRNEVTVFYSRGDISAGSEWYQSIKSELKKSSIGIICLTPENIGAPWIYYESGALAMEYDREAVIPLLANVEMPSRSPLRELHYKELDREGFISVIEAIARLCSVKRYRSDKNLRCVALGAFEVFFSKASEALREIEVQSSLSGADIYPEGRLYIERGSVFVSAPMSSFESKKSYKKLRKVAERVAEEFESHGYKSFFGGRGVRYRSEETSSIKFPSENFERLKHAECFVLLYPAALPSSALIELGYALALNKKIAVFAERGADLPLVLKGLSVPLPNLHKHEVDRIADTVEVVHQNGSFVFGNSMAL